LADLVHERTGGNLFFAIQFLTALPEEGRLRLNPDASRWIWDLARIGAKGYTDNVVDLMVGKLKRLPGATQSACRRASCPRHTLPVTSNRIHARLAETHGRSK
jgi:predicted ATPase